jgi:hypothetical protein
LISIVQCIQAMQHIVLMHAATARLFKAGNRWLLSLNIGPTFSFLHIHHSCSLHILRILPVSSVHQVVVEELEVHKELFYTEGEDALLEARKSIAAWSLPRAAARMAAAKQLRQGGLDVLKVRMLAL